MDHPSHVPAGENTDNPHQQSVALPSPWDRSLAWRQRETGSPV